MYSAFAGTFFILGIGILVAHAMEAFASREGQRAASVEYGASRKFGRRAAVRK
jgi:hypothetical protein